MLLVVYWTVFKTELCTAAFAGYMELVYSAGVLEISSNSVKLSASSV